MTNRDYSKEYRNRRTRQISFSCDHKTDALIAKHQKGQTTSKFIRRAVQFYDAHQNTNDERLSEAPPIKKVIPKGISMKKPSADQVIQAMNIDELRKIMKEEVKDYFSQQRLRVISQDILFEIRELLSTAADPDEKLERLKRKEIIKAVFDTIKSLEESKETRVIPCSELVQTVRYNHFYSKRVLHKVIDSLKRDGELFEPKCGYLTKP